MISSKLLQNLWFIPAIHVIFLSNFSTSIKVCHCNNKGLTGINCDQDIDECVDFPNACVHICQNTYGSYKCDCKSGYKLNGFF